MELGHQIYEMKPATWVTTLLSSKSDSGSESFMCRVPKSCTGQVHSQVVWLIGHLPVPGVAPPGVRSDQPSLTKGSQLG